MIELIFITCLTGAPDDCRERTLVYLDITPTNCVMGAQPELAKWLSGHPNNQIKSWRCQAVSFAERDT